MLSSNVVIVCTAFASVFQSSNPQRLFQRLNWARSGEGGLPLSSVLPTPSGPFYGLPFDPSTTMTRYLPFSVSGNCKAGKIYSISKGSDLLNYKTELECVYTAGRVPKNVPEGPFQGTVLSVVNSRLFNFIIANIWKGKITTKVACKGNETYIGWNNILGSPLVPFVASVGPLALTLAPGEHHDGRDALIFDYTQDFQQVCPDYGEALRTNYGHSVVRRRNLNGVYPFNQIMDTLRLVGQQEDGGSIYLGKSFIKDFYRTDSQAVTFAYWYLVNYDTSASPRMDVMDSLPPLETSFKYMFPGVVDFVLRLLPIDNMLTTPVRSLVKVVQGVLKTGRNSVLYAREIGTGFRSFMTNRRRFQEEFYSRKT